MQFADIFCAGQSLSVPGADHGKTPPQAGWGSRGAQEGGNFSLPHGWS